MGNVRLIGRMDLKMEHLIKGIHLEGWRKVGPPREFARRYYEAGIDELNFMDVVASLYGRNNLSHIVRQAAEEMFIPLTVGGGIRSRDDVKTLLNMGADKVAINTAAVNRPALITEVSRTFGSQCMVLSIEAKRTAPGKWEVYTDNGRERTGRDVVEWAREAQRLGAGEILLTSVDQEGTRKGFDVELTRAVVDATTIPVIASGGMGAIEHLLEVTTRGGADAVAIADALHYGRIPLAEMRRRAREGGLTVRAA